MKLAILKTGGKQYLVEEGSKIEIEKLKNKNIPLVFNDILFYADDDNFLLGQPVLNNVNVEASLIREKKTKTSILKYKSKTRYRKRSGYKKITWVVKIEKINLLKS